MIFVLLPMRIEIEAKSPVVFHCCVTSWWGHMWSALMTRLRWRNGWSAGWSSLGWWTRQSRWARWSGKARWNGICKGWWRWWRRCRWKAWIGPCARQDSGSLAHGLIRRISSRLLHVELRSKLRSWHLLWVPDSCLHRSAPAREERSFLSYRLNWSTRFSTVSSRHWGSRSIRVRHDIKTHSFSLTRLWGKNKTAKQYTKVQSKSGNQN